eukprot:CAMPEP_0116155976 /NCGR_PEP_ID=MMETSP0329-20121206/22590_1 /TAXON_ID=697910 /ORGANISM="Pseudo-nitzschia arenysensis, Strain B593" /LENGTH=858 /DNA_ID=CAMNT_0003653037 /DNA_START=260 /DNA_END=2836 /DNA_ORIENTATION=-
MEYFEAEKHEILIRIPPWVVERWESIVAKAEYLSNLVSNQHQAIYSVLIANQRNSFFVILSMILFWPFYAYCFVAVTSASTWIIWLLASVLVGIVQMNFVAYQFFMISCDIFALTLLKTYQVLMRSRAAQFVFFFNKQIKASRQKMWRRRAWRKQCAETKTYADYVKLPVWEKASSLQVAKAMAISLEEDAPSVHDCPSEQPALRRARSFSTMKLLKEAQAELSERKTEDGDDSLSNSPSQSPRRLSDHHRHHSLSQLKALQDEAEGTHHTKNYADIEKDLGHSTTDLLISTTARIREERTKLEEGQDSGLEFLLSGVVKRNHLGLEKLLTSNARDVEVSGQHGFSSATRRTIAAYYDEVSRGLELLTEESDASDDDSNNIKRAATASKLRERIFLFRKMKQNMGRTALMLSGGGAQAMYHLGTMRALIDANLYHKIKVISGTSGGSIAAACCAMFTPEELAKDLCIETVSTDFRLNGEMKQRNIRWFPPITEMISYWMKHRILIDSDYFHRTCDHYWGTTTFEEAFAKTGKHVCITVSASRAQSDAAQRLLLNHISTPHVTLASAVSASCALPGVMKPAKLKTKNSAGKIEDFEVDGVEWIDGSVQADLPFQRISTLFNVSNFVVCQTNFHVVPFLNKEGKFNKSVYRRLFQTIEWDIRSRALKLSGLGLFPKIFGHDISKIFKQKYYGNLTLVPRFTTMQTFGLHVLVNPNVKHMRHYIHYGQLAAWPYLRVIRYMLRLEISLDEGLERLKSRVQKLGPDFDESDDLDSIASCSTVHMNRTVRFTMPSRQVEALQNKLSSIELEISMLRRENRELRLRLAGRNSSDVSLEEKQSEEKEGVILSEGNVFNLVKGFMK